MLPRRQRVQTAAICLAASVVGGGAIRCAAAANASETTPEYLAASWDTDDGLPNNTVTCIAQTPDRYLWCGTYDGVVRFDGIRFVRIGPDDSTGQQANRIQCLHVDRAGGLWIGTDGAGMWRYSSGKLGRATAQAGLGGDAVRSIAEDAAGNLWLGTRAGLGRFSEGKVTWLNDAAGITNASRSIWNVASDRAGRLWITDWNSLKTFDGRQYESVLPRPDMRPPVRGLYIDKNGAVYLGMIGAAFRREPTGRWTELNLDSTLGNAEVTSFCRTRAGELWLGTRKGLFRQDKGRWIAFPQEAALPSTEVRVLFEDVEGNLWVGTGTAGLVRLKRRMLQSYGAAAEPVLGLAQHPDGRILAGLKTGRLGEVNGRSFRLLEMGAATGGSPIQSLLETRDGALWVGTFGNGLLRVPPHWRTSAPLTFSNVTRFEPSIGSPARTDKVLSLLQDRDGTVWVGTYYSLYTATDTNVLVPVSIAGRALRGPVTSLLEARTGGIWAACEGVGVLRLSGSNTISITRQQGLPSHFVRCLHEDSAGTLWIGTSAGLAVWRDGKVAVIGRAHGLLDDSISQILEDGADNLWLGSKGGIMKAARPELTAAANGEKSSIEFSAFGRGEGMLSEECTGGFSPSGLRAADGTLWFPTSAGVVMLDPSRLQRTRTLTPPPVHVEAMRVDGRLVHQYLAGGEPGLRLGADTKRAEFTFTALSLTAPERLRFKYRLAGFDADWVDAGNSRSAAYAKLPPGRYRFQVIACNNEGLWNHTGDTLAFEVATPYWQTWTFRILAGLALASALGAMVRIISVRHLRRRLRLIEQAHAIEKERMRIAEDMHDEIGGKLSRISFLTELARRNLPERSESSQQMSEVSEAAREVINTVDEIVWAVSPRNDTLDSLAHYLCRHAEEFFELTPVELVLELPAHLPTQSVSADARHNLFCAVKESLNNVLKHAGASRVVVSIAAATDCFKVTVTDNGCGFDYPALVATATSATVDQHGVRRGNGLLNMHERMQSIGGRCDIEAAPGKGTCVVFTLQRVCPLFV